MRLVRRTGLWRCLFWVYVPILFTATHWPNLKLPLPGRSDLIEHLGAFGLWSGLLALAAFYGQALSWRNVRIVWLIAVLYAAFDEGLQAIPFVHRTADWSDLLANVLGISIACTGLLCIGALERRGGGAIRPRAADRTAP